MNIIAKKWLEAHNNLEYLDSRAEIIEKYNIDIDHIDFSNYNDLSDDDGELRDELWTLIMIGIFEREETLLNIQDFDISYDNVDGFESIELILDKEFEDDYEAKVNDAIMLSNKYDFINIINLEEFE